MHLPQIARSFRPSSRREFPVECSAYRRVNHFIIYLFSSFGMGCGSSREKRSSETEYHVSATGIFRAERATLQPLEGVPTHGRHSPPVLWAYPAMYWDYAAQNRRGEYPGSDPGPHRIITDRDKRIQGMATHYPPGETQAFIRAPERVQILGKKSRR